jgi:hypothetical protein
MVGKWDRSGLKYQPGLLPSAMVLKRGILGILDKWLPVPAVYKYKYRSKNSHPVTIIFSPLLDLPIAQQLNSSAALLLHCSTAGFFHCWTPLPLNCSTPTFTSVID